MSLSKPKPDRSVAGRTDLDEAILRAAEAEFAERGFGGATAAEALTYPIGRRMDLAREVLLFMIRASTRHDADGAHRIATPPSGLRVGIAGAPGDSDGESA